MNHFDFKKNIYTLSAELGVPFGILLSLLAVSLVFSVKVPMLSILTVLLLMAAPVVLCIFQRKRFVALDGFALYSELWILAIFTTMGGSLIMALVSYLTISYILPDFLYDLMRIFIDNWPDLSQDTIQTCEKAISQRALPTALEFCMMLFWLFTFLGCVGGAITAFIAEKLPYKQQ